MSAAWRAGEQEGVGAPRCSGWSALECSALREWRAERCQEGLRHFGGREGVRATKGEGAGGRREGRMDDGAAAALSSVFIRQASVI